MSTDLLCKQITAEALTKNIIRKVGINKYNISEIKNIFFIMFKKNKTRGFAHLTMHCLSVRMCTECGCQGESASFFYIIFSGFESVVCFSKCSVSMLRRKVLVADLSGSHTNLKQWVQLRFTAERIHQEKSRYVSFIKIPHPIKLKSEPIGISGSWNCPLATRLGAFASSSAQDTQYFLV